MDEFLLSGQGMTPEKVSQVFERIEQGFQEVKTDALPS